jgi:hypothetical protein
MDIAMAAAPTLLLQQMALERQALEAVTELPMSSTPQGANATFSRFHPGCVYHRRAKDAPGQPAPDDTQAQPDSDTPVIPQPAVESVATGFIDSLTRAQEQPLLQVHHNQSAPTRRAKKKKQPPAPRRKSARIAALSWPKGDAQSKARQVLMRRLGIMQDDEQPSDDLLLRYFALFRGPLTTLVVKALTALCGLEDSTVT